MKRNHQPDLSLVPQIDWARLSAYIDGEGCIGISAQVHKPPFEGRGRYDYIKITVANTDPRLSVWLLRNFGGHTSQRLPDAKWNRWKTCTNWIIGSANAAEILQRCLPYFIIKREQAELAIAFQATMCRSGLRGTPQHVLEYRAEMKTKMHALNARGPRASAKDPETVTH